MVTAEWNRRQTNKINRLMNSFAHFSVPSATIEGIEYFQVESWTKRKCSAFPPANILKTGVILF